MYGRFELSTYPTSFHFPDLRAVICSDNCLQFVIIDDRREFATFLVLKVQISITGILESAMEMTHFAKFQNYNFLDNQLL